MEFGEPEESDSFTKDPTQRQGGIVFSLQEEASTDLHSLHAEVLMTMGQTKVKAMEDMLVVKCLL